jgi:hypothetical protein
MVGISHKYVNTEINLSKYIIIFLKFPVACPYRLKHLKESRHWKFFSELTMFTTKWGSP